MSGSKGSLKRKTAKQASSKPFVVPDRKLHPAQQTQIQGARRTEGKTKKPKEHFAAKNALSKAIKWWETVEEYKDENLLKLNEEEAWYSLLPEYVMEDSAQSSLQPIHFQLAMKSIEKAYAEQVKVYSDAEKSSQEKKSDLKWMNDMIKSGTMSDKVAAMALKVQGSPFHELDTIDVLTALAGKKEQRAAQLAMEALKDLYINNLLPGRLLRAINVSSNIFGDRRMNWRTALLIWFESQIKARYSRLLDALENGLKSNIDYFKRECLQITSELLIGKPEQESRLLSMLVNKLGDPARATCSKAVEVLKQVMRAHPAMKIVIVREVRQFLYRPNLKIRPVFTGVILLSQVVLSPGDHAVAVKLVEGYLSLFEKTMKDEEYGSRLLAALLTGINKALPYLQNTRSLDNYIDPLFKVAHTANSFATATQALMLLSHIALVDSNKTDIQYDHKYKNKTSKAGQTKEPEGSDDTDDDVEEECVEESPTRRRYYRALYAKLLSDQVTSRSRNTLFLNLLYRSIKGDRLLHRALAFIKRLLMCATQSGPTTSASLLFLVSEIMAARPELKVCFKPHPTTGNGNQGSITSDRKSKPSAIAGAKKPLGVISGGHVGTAAASSSSLEENSSTSFLGNFNVQKREPEFAYAADATPSVWEVALMTRHFHPSVQAFAGTLLDPTQQHQIRFAGDPTVAFSLMAFLNRFAYKNPKKTVAEKIKNSNPGAGEDEEPMNTTIAQLEAADVDPDKLFYHKYFTDKEKLLAEGRSRNRSKRLAQNDDADEDDAGDDEEDQQEEEGGGDDEASNDDEEEAEVSDADEAEIDRFADKLALDLMKNANSNIGDDDFDFSEDGDEDDDSEDGLDMDRGLESDGDDDDGDDDDDDDDEGGGDIGPVMTSAALDFEDFLKEQHERMNKTNRSKSTAIVEKEEEKDGESSDDGYTGLVAYGDDDDDDDDDDSSGGSGDLFASAEEYEEMMEANVRTHQVGNNNNRANEGTVGKASRTGTSTTGSSSSRAPSTRNGNNNANKRKPPQDSRNHMQIAAKNRGKKPKHS